MIRMIRLIIMIIMITMIIMIIYDNNVGNDNHYDTYYQNDPMLG
jgi:hypothetical protein